MKNILALLGFIALTSAANCYFNGTAVPADCATGNVDGCVWNNTALWTNCGGNSPSTTDTAFVISGNNTFNLVINNALTLFSLVFEAGSANLGIITVNAPLTVGTIDVSAGSLFIDDDVTINQNASISVSEDATLTWHSGNITWVAGSMGWISVSGQFMINAGVKFVNQNIVVSSGGVMALNTTTDLTMEDGSSIMSNGTIQMSGTVDIAGTTGSQLNTQGSVSLITPATITLSLSTKIYSAFVVDDTTLTINNAFFAQNMTIHNSSVVNIAVTDNSPVAFSSTNFVNYGAVNWQAGQNFNSQGSIVNYGAITVSFNNSVLTCFTSAIENWDTLTLNYNSAIQGDFVNKGTFTNNGAASFVGQNNTFSTITIAGDVIGTGSAIMKSNLFFYQGTYNLPSTILGVMNVLGNDSKVLGVNLSPTMMNISTILQLSTSYTNNKLNTIIGDNALFMPVDNDTSISFTNEGVMGGSFTFDRINVTNDATLGTTNDATVLTFEDCKLTLTNNSNLVVGLSDQNTIPITITHTNRNWGGAPGAILGGTLNIVLLFNPQNGNMTFLKVNGQAPVTGNFTSFNVTEIENANAYNCDYNNSAINYSPSTGEIFLTFENCADLPEESGSGPSKTTIIIIVVVVVVVVVIAAIVGVVLYRRRNAAHHPSEKQRLI